MTEYYWVPEDLMRETAEGCLFDLENNLPTCIGPATKVADHVKYDELKRLLKEVREGLALMAEGEGDNPQTYMDMSGYWMNRIDKALGDGT